MKKAVCFLLLICLVTLSAATASAEEKSILAFFDEGLAGKLGRLEEEPPLSMYYHADNNFDETVTDPGTLREILGYLRTLTVAGAETALQIDDGGIGFFFAWADAEYGICFDTTEYFSFGSVLYPLTDRGPLKKAMQCAADRIGYERENEARGNRVEDIVFFRNGDEAPDCAELTVSFGGTGYVCCLEGAYEILGTVWEDDALLVTFLSGDFYCHDTVVTCRLSVCDGEIVQEF